MRCPDAVFKRSILRAEFQGEACAAGGVHLGDDDDFSVAGHCEMT